MGGISAEQVRANVDKIWPDIKSKLAGWKPQPITRAAQQKPYPLKTFKVKGDEASVSELMFKRRYTLSLPVILPTKERVEKMLAERSRAPSRKCSARSVLATAPDRGTRGRSRRHGRLQAGVHARHSSPPARHA